MNQRNKLNQVKYGKKKLDPSCTYYNFCKIFCIVINALFGTNLCYFQIFLAGLHIQLVPFWIIIPLGPMIKYRLYQYINI